MSMLQTQRRSYGARHNLKIMQLNWSMPIEKNTKANVHLETQDFLPQKIIHVIFFRHDSLPCFSRCCSILNEGILYLLYFYGAFHVSGIVSAVSRCRL